MPFDLPFDYLLAMSEWLIVMAVSFVALLWMRRRCGKGRPKRLACLNLGLSAWMFLAALTAVELYFAVVYDQSDSFNMTNVSRHWFDRHIKPVQKRLIFEDGQQTPYRDARPFPTSLAEGQHHICFVGDSFTFGHGVPNIADRFSDRIGASLERQQPGRFVVSNLADAGRDLHYTEKLLEELLADKLPVQTVVYVICLNDIETFDRRTAELYQEIGDKNPRSWLITHTYFINLLYYRMQQFKSPRVGGYYDFLQDAYSSDAWDGMRRKLEEIRTMCAAGGLDFRIAIFPFLHNLGPDYPFGEAHRRLTEYCQEAGLPVLDLRPVLEPHVGDGLTVNRFDAHPNARAHELAAQAIERELLHDLLE